MADAISLSFTPEYEVVGSQKTKLTFNANLRAREVVEDTAKRSTVSLTAVIDKSVLMPGDNVKLVKQTCAFMLNHLSSKDKMGLVEYDSDVNELIPLSRTSDVFKQEAQSVIANMEAGLSTNLSGGLFEGVRQQQSNVFVDWTQPQSETVHIDSAEKERSEDSIDPGMTTDEGMMLAAGSAVTASGAAVEAPQPSRLTTTTTPLLDKFRSAVKKVIARAQTVRFQQFLTMPLAGFPANENLPNDTLSTMTPLLDKFRSAVKKVIARSQAEKFRQAPRMPIAGSPHTSNNDSNESQSDSTAGDLLRETASTDLVTAEREPADSTVDAGYTDQGTMLAAGSAVEAPPLSGPTTTTTPLLDKFRSAVKKVIARAQTQRFRRALRAASAPAPRSSWASHLANRPRHRWGLDRRPVPGPPARQSRSTRRSMFNSRDPGPVVPLDADALRSVFLVTDGLATEGITATSELVAALGQRLDSSPRVRVFTFGFGTDHSPELLAELATAGSGTYYFMERGEAIPTALADALGGLLSVAAQNVALEFRPADGVTVSNVHTAFPTGEAGGGARRVAVGDVLSEEDKDFLFEVELPTWDTGSPAWDGEAPHQRAQVAIGTLVLSYLDVQEACLRRVEVECKVGRAEVVPTGVVGSERVAIQRARVETAQSMAEARKAAAEGDLAGAREVLDRCLERLEGVEGGLKSQLCADLREAQRNVVDGDTYSTRGSKVMWAKQKAHAEQRSACLSDSEDDSDGETGKGGVETFSYANSTRRAMRTKAKALSRR